MAAATVLTRWRLAGLLLRRPSAGFCPTRCTSGAPSPPPTFPSKCGAPRSSGRRCPAGARSGRACGGGGAEPRGPGGACEGDARPPEPSVSVRRPGAPAWRAEAGVRAPGASSGRRRGGPARRELRRSGARRPAAGEPPPPSALARAPGGPRSFQRGSDVTAPRVPEPALKVLSSALSGERSCGAHLHPGQNLEAGEGASLLLGLEVGEKIGKEGRSGAVLLLVFENHHHLGRNGLMSKTGNWCIFYVAIQIK